MPVSMESFRVFVSQLAKRPGMWVELPASVTSFAAAIAGYEAALRDANVSEFEFLFSRPFGDWLTTKWRVTPVVGWETHIKERFGNGEAGIAEAANLIEQWFDDRDTGGIKNDC